MPAWLSIMCIGNAVRVFGFLPKRIVMYAWRWRPVPAPGDAVGSSSASVTETSIACFLRAEEMSFAASGPTTPNARASEYGSPACFGPMEQ